ncbi:MAG: CotH kinase family protein, partial [Candidatus Zixiibacteriota bacterium]
TDTLLDGLGDTPDWIEIYNPTDTTISLDGWYLTNDKSNLTMWQFPDGLQIASGEFLIVFASKKTEEDYPHNYPYQDPAGYYHTNFNLGDGGDYLALVGAGGARIAHEYEPTYPTQLANISYGLAQYRANLVPTGATARYHVPTIGDAGTNWTAPEFDDSEWESGLTGLGFGISGVTDEGLVAHYEFEGDASDSSGNGHDGTEYGDPYYVDGVIGQAIDIDGNGDYVVVGDVGISGDSPRTIAGWARATNLTIPSWTNVFGFTSLGGCDLHFDIIRRDYNWYAIHTFCFERDILPIDLDWHHFSATYDGTTITWYGDGIYIGSEARALNTIDNVHMGKRGDNENYFPGRLDDVCIYDRVLSNDEISLLMGGGVIGTDVQSQMQNINASLWARIEFDIEEGEVELFNTLTLRMKYEDGFVAYINGQEVAHCNSPALVEWDSTADSDRPSEKASVFEEINITAHLGTLQSGRNVLAIQGLNDDRDDSQFLILPELVAARNQVIPEYFTTPTPGTFNISGAKGVVSDVWFSDERQFYVGPANTWIKLTLSTGTEGAEIRYTLDGSRPTETHGLTFDPLTDDPLDIKKTTIVRAVAVKPGWLDSKVETHTYIFTGDVKEQSPTGLPPDANWPSFSVNGQIINYGMDPTVVDDPSYSGQIENALKDIPTISLATDLANLFDPVIGIYVNAYNQGLAWERPVSVELINPDGSEGFQIDAGLRIRGGYSRSDANPKHAFRLFFRAEYGQPKLKFPMFDDEGVKEFDHIDLRTAQNYSWSYHGDSRNTLAREVFSRDVQRDMGQPYTRSRYYHLYVNGHYWGLYMTQERSEASYAESYFGGDKDEYDVVKVETFVGYIVVATDGYMDAFQRLWEASMIGFETDAAYYAVQGLNPDGTRNPDYEVLVDIDNLIDYMICSYYVGDPD